MRAIYMLSLLLSGAIIFLGSSSGPGAVQGQDRTGGPLANGFCGNCHAAGAFNPSMSLELLKDGNAVMGYMPGETYTMRVTITADAGAQVYGFQAVALSGDDNVQAGSWTPPMGTRVTPLNGRDYIEHNQRSESNIFEVEWTAPANGVGNISFYSASVSANNMSGSGGDGATRLENPVVLNDLTVSTNDLPELANSINIFPNPVADQLNLQVEVEEATDAELTIYNGLGQPMLRRAIQLGVGNNQEQMDLSNFPTGHYSVEIRNREAASRKMLLKQ